LRPEKNFGIATSVLSDCFHSVAERTVSTTLSMAYFAMLRVNWPDSILAMSSTVLMYGESNQGQLAEIRAIQSASHGRPPMAAAHLPRRQRGRGNDSCTPQLSAE
jgi:hypothetical protein